MRIPGVRFVQGRNEYADADGRHYGIAIHNTSNNASDEQEASYATRRTDGTSSHLYVDDDSVTQSLSLTKRAGHAGSREGNDHAIAVEITGANGWSRQKWLASVAWDKLGAALAWVIRNDPDYKGFQVRRASVAEMKANPRVRAFYGHDDMRRAWGGTTHTDPGPNFPWDRLFKAVNDALGGKTPSADTKEDDVSKADAIAALEAVRPFQAGGPRGRLKDPKRFPPKGWADMSPRMLLEYLFEGSMDIGAELRAARMRDEAILAKLDGQSGGEILARIDKAASADAARHAELVNLVGAQHAEMVDLVGKLGRGEIAVDEFVRVMGERLAAAAPPSGAADVVR